MCGYVPLTSRFPLASICTSKRERPGMGSSCSAVSPFQLSRREVWVRIEQERVLPLQHHELLTHISEIRDARLTLGLSSHLFCLSGGHCFSFSDVGHSCVLFHSWIPLCVPSCVEWVHIVIAYIFHGQAGRCQSALQVSGRKAHGAGCADYVMLLYPFSLGSCSRL